MFSRPKPLFRLPPGGRIILISGGGGQFGQVLLEAKPKNAIIVNVSRRRSIQGPQVINCHFDLSHKPEQAFAHLKSFLPFIDVFVYAAYAPIFSSFEHIERERFLKEYELNVYTAVHTARLCAEHFWTGQATENEERGRKVIFVSSAASFGMTARPELATYGATKAALNALGPYAHDYLQQNFGVSAHVLAPGSLGDTDTREKLVRRFWELEPLRTSAFTLERIV